jgi:ATP-dependent DNA helicase RecG (EC 3.6.1.-)
MNQVRYYSEQFLNLDENQQQSLITRWITDDKTQYVNT